MACLQARALSTTASKMPNLDFYRNQLVSKPDGKHFQPDTIFSVCASLYVPNMQGRSLITSIPLGGVSTICWRSITATFSGSSGGQASFANPRRLTLVVAPHRLFPLNEYGVNSAAKPLQVCQVAACVCWSRV